MPRTSSIGLWAWALCGLSAGGVATAQDPCNATETEKCSGLDIVSGDRFGHAVAISGDTAVIGNPNDDHAGFASGAGHIFHYDGEGWVEQPKALPSSAATQDQCGWAVSVQGNVAVFGAYGDDSAAFESGSAYIFRFNGTTWQEDDKLMASDAFGLEFFGDSVSNHGDVVLIGAPQPGFWPGKAYVYRYNGAQWDEEDILTASDADTDDQFGDAVAVQGNTALIGAHHDDEAGEDAGAVYVFRFNAQTSRWGQDVKLMASDASPDLGFGREIAISGDFAVIGANSDDPLIDESGAAYVFRYDGNTWDEEQKLTAPTGASLEDDFGRYVSISGDIIVVGAPFHDGVGTSSGAAYLYQCNVITGNWDLVAKLAASDAAEGDTFGAVATDGQNVLVGSPQSGSGGASYVYAGLTDCNDNQTLDLCDIAGGSPDTNTNGVPDECEGDCPWNIAGDDNQITINDFFAVLAAWGPNPGHPADFDGNDEVDAVDFFDLIAHWGPCP
jgi:hypothetical protein